jgi:hypothetical protein
MLENAVTTFSQDAAKASKSAGGTQLTSFCWLKTSWRGINNPWSMAIPFPFPRVIRTPVAQ